MSTPVRLAVLASLLLAGATVGTIFETLRSPRVEALPAPTTRYDETPALLSKGLEEGSSQQQLLWIASHASEKLDFQSKLDALHAEGLGQSKAAIGELLALWASRDPLAALAYIKGLKGTALRHALEPLFTGWAEQSAEGLAAWLRENRVDPLFQSPALAAIARHDPNLAFALISDYGNDKQEQYRSLFTELGKSNPRMAILLLDKLPKNERSTPLWVFVSSWAQYDVSAATSWAQGLEDSELRASALPAIVASIAFRSPEEAARLALEELTRQSGGDSSLLEANLFMNLFSAWGSGDAAAAKAWIGTLPPQYRAAAMQRYRDAVAMNNPSAVLREFEQSKSISGDDQVLLSESLSSLAGRSPSTALSWLDENREWIPKSMLPDVLAGVLRRSPELSPKLLPMLTDGVFGHNAYRQAGQTWAEADPAQAASYLSTLAAGGARDAFEQGLFQQTVANDVEAAYLFLEQTPEGPQRENLLHSLALGSKDYLATANWLSANSEDSKGDGGALAILVRAWAQASPSETATWLKEAPASPRKEMLTLTFSVAIAQRDPSSAIQWASTITDEATRHGAMERVAHEWLNSDKKAAMQWIRQAPFSDEVKQRLLH